MSTALGAASMCFPGTLLAAPPAMDQSVAATALSADIPQQPLAEALAAFARQTGLQLVYESNVVGSKRSGAAFAGMSANDALHHILRDTGLQFEYLTSHSIRILSPRASALPKSSVGLVREDRPSLEEVIVTATRRAENVQEIPMTVQVLTADILAELNVTTFDDYVRYLPGVTAQGVGPSQSNIYIRGLSTPGSTFLQSSGTFGASPAVAVYLDEQSVELLSRNLDVYVADLDRIEVLEGPQGTLFGAGAEAGVVRYITHKPELNNTEATLNAGLATTEHGAPSNSFDVTFNIPISADKLAVRAVMYDERRGGYIANLPAIFARADTDASIQFAGAGGRVPVNSLVINNFNITGGSINPVTYQGGRIAGLYQLSEDWTALLTQSYQDIVADGIFTEMAANSLGELLPDLSVQLFNPSYDKDRFENTALTVEGRLGALRLLYAGSYLQRHVEQVQDYTAYARGGAFADYYQCVNPGPTAVSARCFTPSSTWHDVERNTHLSQELRLRTPDDWRIRGVGGAFYEKDTVQEQVDWFYETAFPYFNPVGPPTGYYTLNGSVLLPNGSPVQPGTQGAVFVYGPATSINPYVRPPGDAFFYDITRAYKQKAAYGSIDYDLARTLTVSAGTRYFDIDTSEIGSAVGSSGYAVGCQVINFPAAPNPCVNYAYLRNFNSVKLNPTFSGFTSRASLRWKITDDGELYYSWSQGLRVGGANRLESTPGSSPLAPGSAPYQAQALAHGGWNPPPDFAPDTLTNNELGWKAKWLTGRIQWNGALYQENWSHVQTTLYNLGVLGNAFITNGGDYRVRGIETSALAHLVPSLTVNTGVAWNQSELLKRASFLWADGTPINFGSLQTGTGQGLSDPSGTLGSPLAGAPAFQGNVRVRYDFTLGGCAAFAQIGAIHQAHSYASTDRLTLDLQGNPIAYDLPGFSAYDAAVGISRGAWLVRAYGENLTDTRAELYANYRQFYKGVTVSRPRTIGLRVNYKFGGD